MSNIIQKIKQKFGRFTRKMDEYQVELTFAEAGVVEEGETIIGLGERKEKEQKQTLLVVGDKGTFSDKIVDYAIDMATRMSYEILALSTSDLSCETIGLFPDSKNKICEDFNTLSQENSKIFAERAKEAGISFNHRVLFSDVDSAINAINRETGDISFVVNESFEDPTRVSREESRDESRLFVYSIV